MSLRSWIARKLGIDSPSRLFSDAARENFPAGLEAGLARTEPLTEEEWARFFGRMRASRNTLFLFDGDTDGAEGDEGPIESEQP